MSASSAGRVLVAVLALLVCDNRVYGSGASEEYRGCSARKTSSTDCKAGNGCVAIWARSGPTRLSSRDKALENLIKAKGWVVNVRPLGGTGTEAKLVTCSCAEARTVVNSCSSRLERRR